MRASYSVKSYWKEFSHCLNDLQERILEQAQSAPKTYSLREKIPYQKMSALQEYH